MWSNDIKCKYMFMFPLKNLALKGLSIGKHHGLMFLPLWNHFLLCSIAEPSSFHHTHICIYQGNYGYCWFWVYINGIYIALLCYIFKQQQWHFYISVGVNCCNYYIIHQILHLSLLLTDPGRVKNRLNLAQKNKTGDFYIDVAEGWMM